MNEIFYYHEDRQLVPPGVMGVPPGPMVVPALLVIDHGSKQGTFYPVSHLRAAGWKVTVEGLRASLPRFQQTPTLLRGDDKSVKQAATLARKRADFDSRIRH